MKRILSVLAALLLLTFMMPLAHAINYKSYDYYIKDFHVEVTANADRSYDVTETITVDFKLKSRGIYRDIDIVSSVERYKIENIHVAGDPYTIEDGSDYIRVRIGDPNVYMTGEKTYVITYTRVHYDDGVPEYDYFYMDLIGDGWDVPIAKFSAAVKLPEDAEIHTYTLTSGPTGSTGNDYARGDATYNIIDVRMQKPLEPYMAVTLNVEMLPGAFGAAEVFSPAVEIHSIDVKAELDEYGVMRVEEHYDATIHKSVQLQHPILSKNNYWIDPNGAKRSHGQQYTDFFSFYVGNRIQFSYVYEMENAISGLASEYSLLLCMIGNYDVVSVDAYTVELVSPFAIKNCTFWDGYQERNPDAYTMSLSNGGKKLQIETATRSIAQYAGVAFVVPGLKRQTTELDYIVPGVAGAVALFLFLFAFVKFERKMVPAIEFYPPNKMNPAEVGYIIDKEVSARDITSLIYYWAACGNLRMEVTDNENFRDKKNFTDSKHFTLYKIADLDSTHKPYEHDMFNQLFEYGIYDTVTSKQLEQKFFRNLSSAGGSLEKYFTKEKPLEKFRTFPVFVNFFIILGSIMMFLVFSHHWEYFYERNMVYWAGAIMMCHVEFLALSKYLQFRHRKAKGKTTMLVFSIVFFAIFAACFITVTMGSALSAVSSLVTLFAYAVCFLSTPNLPRKTELGIDLLERCIGFKMFLETAEKTRLEMLLKENPEYYFDILPYAQVLGVSEIWEEKFDGLISNAPGWCSGEGVQSRMYARDVRRVSDSISRTMTSLPPGKRSSSGGFSGTDGDFSGGGSSGGGGGGGGGRW